MAIRVAHEPQAATIANAAFVGGLGDFQRYQDQLALQVAEMQQRAAAQQAQVQADQQRMAMAQQQAALDRQHDFARMAQQAHLDQARMGMQWQMGGLQALESNVGGTLAELTKSHDKLTPEGRRILGDLTGKYRALQKERINLRPQQYGEVLARFGEELERSGIRGHVIEPQPLIDQFNAEVVDHPTYGLMSRDRNGAWRQAAQLEKDKPVPALPPLDDYIAENVRPLPDGSIIIRQPDGKITLEAPKPKTDSLSGAANFDSLYSVDRFGGDALKAKGAFQTDFDKARTRLEAQRQAEAVAAAGRLPEGAAPPAPKPVKDEEVIAEMRKSFDLWRSLQPAQPAQQESVTNFRVGEQALLEEPESGFNSEPVTIAAVNGDGTIRVNDRRGQGILVGQESLRKPAQQPVQQTPFGPATIDASIVSSWQPQRTPYAPVEVLGALKQRGVTNLPSESEVAEAIKAAEANGMPIEAVIDALAAFGSMEEPPPVEKKPQAGKPVKLEELPPAERELAERSLPRPRSKADFDALPSGASFIAPDGTLWIKP